MKLILSLFIVLTFPFYADAQIQFTSGWPMDPKDDRNNLEQTSDGGYVICGSIGAPLSLIPQCYLMKVDSTGHQQWMTQFPTSLYAYTDAANASVCQTPDGGYAIATSFYHGPQSLGVGYRVIYLVRTDAAGNLLWAQTYPGAGRSISYCIDVTADNGFIVAGSTTDSIANLNYAYLLRTDSAGGVVWSTCYWPQNDNVTPSGITGARFYSASQTSDGGFIASGQMNANSDKGSIIMKTDSSGNVTWSQGHIESPNDWVYDYDVQELPDGGFITCGEDYTVQYYCTLTRFSASGVPLWRKTYGDVNDTQFWSHLAANSVAVTPDGFTFSIAEWVSPGDRMRMVHTDTAGNLIWTKRYEMTRNSMSDVEATTDGGYAFTAYTPGTFGNYLMLYKTDSLGVAPCDDYMMADTAFDVDLPASRPLSTMSVGYAVALSTTLTPVVMTDSNMCENVVPHGIEEALSNLAPSVFPNPAGDEVFVALSNLAGNTVNVRMFDAFGREVAAVAAPNCYGEWQKRFETTALAEGVYLITVEIDGSPLTTQKVIILD